MSATATSCSYLGGKGGGVIAASLRDGPRLADAARARWWKARGLRPFPWKACGLRCAHRRRSGAFRPLPACPHPFHGAAGRTGPAGLPTGFPPPRPAAGDRSAFSTRPADECHQHQQQNCQEKNLKTPAPLAAPQRLMSYASLFHELPLLVVQENGGRCTSWQGFWRLLLGFTGRAAAHHGPSWALTGPDADCRHPET